MIIAEANRTNATNWRNHDMSWSDFVATLEQKFRRTPETMAEYTKMSKSEQSAIKSQAGGFVGGQLRGGRRTKENVVCRTMVTLDADYATENDWGNFTCLYDGFAVVAYPTHKSTPAKPRLRWVLPASRQMTPEEYPAVARRVAEWIGIETMDGSSYDINRLFYYPTVPQDAPYELLRQAGAPLDVDAVLASYGPHEAWKDAGLWPVSSRELTQTIGPKGKVEDPTIKKGAVGLFCRTYDVEAAIAEFLPDIYEETATHGRYTYLAGSTSGGAVVVDSGNGFYSFHSTDPAGGRTRNAFDLVRIHKFGGMDKDKSEDDATPTQRPSYKAMVEWMDNLEAVTEQKLREGNEQFDADFGDMAEATDENTAEKAPPFVIKGARGQLKVDATRLAEYVRRNLHYRLVRDTATEAQRVFVYDRGVYQQCAPEMFQGKIKEFIRDYSKPLVSMPPVMEAYHQLMTDTNYEKQTSLDADKDLINFRNGVLRLSDMTLLPHSPGILSTIQVPCDWIDKEPETPVFDAYMHTLTSGNDGVKQLLLEFMGVALSNVPGCKMKKALFLFGPGNTGKSQLRILLTRLLGDRLCSSADLADLEARFGTSNLYGKRLVGSPDMRYATVRELRVFKTVSAGDPIMVEFKGQPAFSYTYQGVLWFCANELPCFGGDNGPWVYERIVPVRCSNVVPEEERDALLVDRMYAEREGIVYQAVQALKRVIRNGYRYDIPKSVLAERQRYQVENDSVLSFFGECMRHTMPGEKFNSFCTTGRVYRVYQAWCRQNTRNGYAKSQTDFRKALAMHLKLSTGDLIVRQKGQSYYRGITLRREAKIEYADDYDCFVDMETTETA
mgnify:FL=1